MNKRFSAGLADLCLLVLLGLAFFSGSAAGNAVTVRDSIEMTVLTDPEPYMSRFGGGAFKRSPDGEKFFIVTRQGDIDGNYNEYRLIVFDMSEIKGHIDAEEVGRPAGELVARFRSTSNRPAITGAHWMEDSRTIAFIGENPEEPPQAYTVHSNGDRLTRLTDHPTAVRDFDVNLDSDSIVYLALVPAEWSEKERNGVVLDNQIAWEVMQRNRGEWFYERVQFFTGTKSGNYNPVDMTPYDIRSSSWGISLSPDGRKAIGVIHVDKSPDFWWSDYEPVRENPYFGSKGPHNAFASFTSEHREVFLQYVIIDMATGKMEPVFNAPAAMYFGGWRLAAHWVDNGNVVLVNTFLPLENVETQERERRQKSGAVVELNIDSGTVTRITDIKPTNLGKSAVSGNLHWSKLTSDKDLLLTWKLRDGEEVNRVYHRTGKGWVEVSDAKIGDMRADRFGLELSIAQDLNTPPDIAARSIGSGRRILITDLNPQFDELTLGRAEIIEWETEDGRRVQGNLLRPLDYQPDKRYPLVIQTHGYNKDTFFMDGPGNSPSGYAARPLAAVGIAVLQVPDVTPKGFREELSGQMLVYKAAIKKLDEMGLIDPDKVGMHGWSRTGLYVQHAITFSDLNLAAASVSDPGNISVLYHALSFKSGYPGMLEQERLVGAPLWGDEGRKLWAERDPIFHLDKVTAPLKIETYGRTFFGWWDVYALLRRHRKPVEYIYYPDGDHVLTKPRERLLSQQGAVDWYRFWLKGDEDNDPAKAEQYERWRALRESSEVVGE